MAPLYEAVNMNTLPPTIGRPGPKPTDQLTAVDMVRVLLDHGANPNAELKAPIRPRHHNNGDAALGAGTTPLMRAAKSGDVANMRLLLDKGADLNMRQRNGNTAMMIAAGFGSRAADNADEEPTDRGTQADAIEAIKLCLERGADLHTVNWTGETALFLATGDAIIRFLVARGLGLDEENYSGETPLKAWLGRVDRDGKLTRPATVAVLRELMASGAATAPSRAQ
jgi:ankyrin repeat protein